MHIKEYKITRTFRSPESGASRGTQVRYKTFKAGEVVEGYANDIQIDGVRIPAHIVVGGKWVIPMTHVSTDLSGDHISNKGRLTKGELPKSIRDKIASIDGGNPIKMLAGTNKAATRGMVLGALVGAGYSWYKGRNILIAIIIGGIAGALAGRLVAKSGVTIQKKEA